MQWDDKTRRNKLQLHIQLSDYRMWTGHTCGLYVGLTNLCQEGADVERIWTSPPSLFSVEKTDLYFIGLHTWKRFTPYA